MPDVPRLLAAANQVAKTADSLSASFAKELSRVQRDLERQLLRLVTDVQGGSRTAIALAARGIKLRKQIRGVLTDAGYDDLADTATVGALERMTEAMAHLRVAQQVSAFTSSDLTRIEALKELARMDVLAKGDEIGIAVWRSVLQGLYSQRKPIDIIEDLADALDKDMAEAATLYDTGTSVFGRQVEAMKAGDDPENLYLYAGPVDARLRPFCKQHVGKVYNRAEIDKMDNGQLPNVFLTAGGYACRHSLIAISKFSELTDLHDTDERVPEIADQLKRVQQVTQKAA